MATERMISELIESVPCYARILNRTAFIIGNGLSRKCPLVIKQFREHNGPVCVFGCNALWQDPDWSGSVDFSAARDMGRSGKSPIMNLLEQDDDAQIFLMDRKWGKGLQEKIAAWKGTIYRYSSTREYFSPEFNPKVMSDGDRVFRRLLDTFFWGAHGDTGGFLLQVAHRMGFREIRLVGFDGCFLPGEVSAHTHTEVQLNLKDNREDHSLMKTKDAQGDEVRTFQYLLDFSRDTQNYADMMIREGIKVSKVGPYGMLRLPIV